MSFNFESADVKPRADKAAVIALHSQNQIETLAGF
jgi:hypothetical protein